MGQSGSTAGNDTSKYDQNLNKIQNKYHNTTEIEEYFLKRAIRHLTASEFLSYSVALNDKKNLDEIYPPQQLLQKLHIPEDNKLLSDIILKIFKVSSNYPLVNDIQSDASFGGVLKAAVLLSSRGKKYAGHKSFDVISLLFIALSKVGKENVLYNTISLNESYQLNEVLDNYNETNFDELTVDPEIILCFVTWLLTLNHICPTDNCKLNCNIDNDEWKSFELSAKNIIRSMNSEAFTSATIRESMRSITFQEFSTVFRVIIPNILIGLENLVEHLLYQEKDLVDTERPIDKTAESKLLSRSLYSQINASLPKEVAITKLQKLYIGRESGFSMRSLQSKVFKWVAPTIVLISGMRITDDEEYGSSKNPRYKKFLEHYPKLRDDDQHLEKCFERKRKVTFAVFIKEPWKVTNKSYFGGTNTTIIQLSPRQDIYHSNTSDIVYFNTVGGGIGIGSTQPIIKSKLEKQQPGNVSLTIDNALEFAAFRNVGYGGKLNPSSLQVEKEITDKNFELRFIIQDIEVWGCGGAKELEEQIRQLQWEEKEAKRRQHVNLKSLGEDRALLEMAGLVGQHQSGGSM